MTALATIAEDRDFLDRPRLWPGVGLVSVAIPGEPQAKERPRVVRGRAITPERTKVAEDAIRWALKSVLRGQKPNATSDIAVELVFHCQASWADDAGHQADLDNLVKLVLDASNKLVWADDRQVVHLLATVVRGDAKPRTLFRAWTIA